MWAHAAVAVRRARCGAPLRAHRRAVPVTQTAGAARPAARRSAQDVAPTAERSGARGCGLDVAWTGVRGRSRRGRGAPGGARPGLGTADTERRGTRSRPGRTYICLLISRHDHFYTPHKMSHWVAHARPRSASLCLTRSTSCTARQGSPPLSARSRSLRGRRRRPAGRQDTTWRP